MTQDSALQSLIPYLDSTQHPFALRIAFPARTRDSRDNSSDSFVILNDTDPLARLFMGKLVTSTGSTLKDLYLLVQRDEYCLYPPLPHLHNNTDIEHAWQEAARLSAATRRGALSFAPGPAGVKHILPFRSLFYCALRDLFFHPPCPSCGGLLELCTDDQMLKPAGLAPYATSIQRYLYCPSCIGAGNTPLFFVPRKEQTDPSTLADLIGLIRGFRPILANAKESFPCSRCPEKDACYTSEGKAERRIVPFSFFPFYLMAFDSYPVDAMDCLNAPSLKAASSAVEFIEEPPKDAGPQPAARPQQAEEGPAAVMDVLLALRKKWAGALPKPDEPPVPRETKQAPEQDIKELPVDMLEKTMIFSPAEMETANSTMETPTEQDAPPSLSSEPPQTPPPEVVLEKTMIFSPGTVPAPPSAKEKPPRKAPPAGPQPREPAPEDLLEKTVANTPGGEKHHAPEQAKKARETEAIPETVIMSLDDLKGRK